MTKQKSTKRALLLSALSLLMCVSMLIGSTFAWFTDSVTSGGNIIKSGTLDVTMEWADGTKAVPADESTDWIDASTGAIFKSELWEPGYTEVRHIKIANEGTLALKYQLNIIANGEVSELADVIDVYYVDPATQVADRTALSEDNKLGTLSQVLEQISTTASGNLKAGEKDTITIALKMQESAGNKYQGLSIGSEFAVQLMATQLTHEFDSFDNQYDAFADYDGEISNATSLAAALKNGGTYKLTAAISIDESMTIPEGTTVNLDLNGQTLTATTDAAIRANGNLTLAGNGTLAGNSSNYVVRANSGSNVTVEEGVVISGGFGAIAAPGGTVTVNGGDFSNVEVNGSHYVVAAYDGGKVIINGGNFKFAEDQYAAANGAPIIGTWSNGSIEINGGTFDASSGSALCYKTASVVVKGGTFKNAAAITYGDGTVANMVADGYSVLDNADASKTVVKGSIISESNSLSTAISSGATDVYLTAGTYTIPSDAQGKTLTISGTEDAKVNITSGLTYANGANVTFRGITIESEGEGAGYSNGFAQFAGVTFEDCVINGTIGLYSNSKFVDCEFNVSGNYYNVWTWGAATAEFEGCTFNCDGKALLVYANETGATNPSQTVKITNCVFNDNGNGDVSGKAAVEITSTYANKTYDVIIKNTQVNGFDVTVPGTSDFNASFGSVENGNIGTNVWGNKCKLSSDYLNVVIDGKDVY